MPLLLTDLPNELLQHILMFAGSDAKSLLNCEKTCRILRDVTRNDKTWRCIPNSCLWWDEKVGLVRMKVTNDHEYLGYTSNRMRACICYVHGLIMKEAARDSSPLAAVLNEDDWIGLVYAVLDSQSDSIGIDIETELFNFRRDTLFVLAEIAQASVIRLLSRANTVSSTIAATVGKYPILTCDNLRHELVHEIIDSLESIVPRNNDSGREFVLAACELLSEVERHAIVRRLSRRAGIVRMSNDAYDLAWGTFIHMILMLLRPTCVKLVTLNERGNGKRMLGPSETISKVPPLSKTPLCDDCGNAHFCLHTPVPKQIEDTAKSLGLPHLIYGIVSLSESEVEEDYEFQDENDDPFTWVNEDDDTSWSMEVVQEEDSDEDMEDEDSDEDMEEVSSDDGSSDYSDPYLD